MQLYQIILVSVPTLLISILFYCHGTKQYLLKDWLARTFVEKPQFRLNVSRISKFLEHYRGVLASSKICLSFFVACHRELTPWGFCTNKKEQLCLIIVPNISHMKDYFEKVVRGQKESTREGSDWLVTSFKPAWLLSSHYGQSWNGAEIYCPI